MAPGDASNDPNAAPETALRTPVWLLHGMTQSEPGVLELAGGRIAFTSDAGRVFDVAVGEGTRIIFPWYYFGGGMKITSDGVTHRISFVRPNGAQVACTRLLQEAGAEAAGLLTAQRKIADIGEGRRAGKAWRAALRA